MLLRDLGSRLEGSLAHVRGLLLRHRAAGILLGDGVVVDEGSGLRPEGEEQHTQNGYRQGPPSAVPRTPAPVALFRPRWSLPGLQTPLRSPRVASKRHRFKVNNR